MAQRLAEGVTIESPWVRIPAGIPARLAHDARVVRAFKRLSSGGLLRCNANLSDCRVGPRGKLVQWDGAKTLRLTIGYLTIDDVTAVAPIDEHSARGEITLRFQPAFEYKQYRTELRALMDALDDESINQSESDAVAQAVFHRADKGWHLETVQQVKRTGITSWKSKVEEAEGPADVLVNLAPSAAVTVSSERSSAGQSGASAADGVFDDRPNDQSREWVAAEPAAPARAWLRLTWRAPVQAWEIILYDRPNPDDNIRGGILQFSDGSSITVGQLPNDGAPYRVEFPPKSITWVQFNISSAVGRNVGLGEIEVYGLQ